MRRAVLSILLVGLFVSLSGAQSTVDTFKVEYFDNAQPFGTVDGTVRITNSGTSGEWLCAQIFVFDPYQEIQECCSCPVSWFGLRKLSVNTDLTSDPLTGVQQTSGSIEIVSTNYDYYGCRQLPITGVVTPGIRAWATHLQDSGTLTESAAQDVSLSAQQLLSLHRQCYAIELTGSGKGLCTCGTGD